MRYHRTMARTLAIVSTLMVGNSSAQGRTLRNIHDEGNLSKGDGATDST